MPMIEKAWLLKITIYSHDDSQTSDTQNLKHSDSAFDADDRESVVVLSASLLLMFLPL